MASTSRARRRPVKGDVTGKDYFAAARLDDQWMLVVAACAASRTSVPATCNGVASARSTFFTSLKLICPSIPLFTTPASLLLLAPAPPAKAGVSAGGLGGLGFYEMPPAGLGRKGGGARVGSVLVLGFSKAAMRSCSEPGLGCGGGGGV
ncbi:hypothetical protein B0H13DRAFT_2672610 [Mycena leptocephala]|nr:hypothetical protein B0H13DRAFT_2672610 [Mycena leptocephala]